MDYTLIDEDELQAQLALDGLIAPVMEEISNDYRQAFDHWFAYARQLNRTSIGSWVQHWTAGAGQSVNSVKPTASRIFGRAINAYAATVSLSENTMPIEALSLSRSIYEAGFWLGHLDKDSDQALSDLEVDEIKNLIAREDALKERYSGNLEISDASRQRRSSAMDALSGRKKNSIDRIAKSLGPRSRYVEYRVLCGFYGHTSESSLRHHLQSVDGIIANTLGPHGQQIPKAVYFSSDALISCGMAFSAIMSDKVSEDAFQSAYRTLKSMEHEYGNELASAGFMDDP